MKHLHTFAGVLLAAGLTGSAAAVPVYSGELDITIPRTFAGLSLDVVDGTTGTGFGDLGESDINIYFAGGNTLWSFFQIDSGDPGDFGTVVDGDDRPVIFDQGDLIGPSSTLRSGATFSGTGGPLEGFVGFKFNNEAGDTDHFGWILVDLPATGDGTLLGYGFESTPDTAIAAGAGIPEPASLSLLATGSLLLIRRRR